MNNDLKAQYDEQGYVIARNVLDQELMGEVKEHVEWLIKQHPELRPENLHTGLVHDDPFWIRLISDDRLLDVAEQFVGLNIALFASHYICKPAFRGKPVLWHQDGSYWPLRPMNVVSLWLAVDDSVSENGCLRVIPGTHTTDLQALKERDDVENVLGSEMERAALVDEDSAVDLILRAGDVSIHHPNVVHGSKANHSPMRRCGLTIRYIPTTTEILKKPWDSAFLLRGEPVPGINAYLPWPRFNPERHLAFRGCDEWNHVMDSRF